MDRHGATPLMLAAAMGLPSVSHRLLDAGADLSIRHKFTGATALHMAVVMGQLEVIETLRVHPAFEAFGVMDLQDYAGRTASIVAEGARGPMVVRALAGGTGLAVEAELEGSGRKVPWVIEEDQGGIGETARGGGMKRECDIFEVHSSNTSMYDMIRDFMQLRSVSPSQVATDDGNFGRVRFSLIAVGL